MKRAQAVRHNRPHRPDLTALYAAYHRGKYAPREVHDEIESRVGRGLRPNVGQLARVLNFEYIGQPLAHVSLQA